MLLILDLIFSVSFGGLGLVARCRGSRREGPGRDGPGHGEAVSLASQAERTRIRGAYDRGRRYQHDHRGAALAAAAVGTVCTTSTWSNSLVSQRLYRCEYGCSGGGVADTVSMVDLPPVANTPASPQPLSPERVLEIVSEKLTEIGGQWSVQYAIGGNAVAWGVGPDVTGKAQWISDTMPWTSLAPLLADDLDREYLNGIRFFIGVRVATLWAKAGKGQRRHPFHYHEIGQSTLYNVAPM